MIAEPKPIFVTITYRGAEYSFSAWTAKEVEREFLVWLKKFIPAEYDKVVSSPKVCQR